MEVVEALMRYKKIEAAALIFTFLIVTLYHLSDVYFKKKGYEQKLLHHKKLFNARLKNMNRNEEYKKLSYLKILINNYQSLDNPDILYSENINELRRCVENLKMRPRERWYFLSLDLLIGILGPMVIPPISYAVRQFY